MELTFVNKGLAVLCCSDTVVSGKTDKTSCSEDRHLLIPSLALSNFPVISIPNA